MSTEEPQPDPDDPEEPSRPADGDAGEPPKLRRGLLGYRAKGVHAELEARRVEAEALRADVAALWLAFGQHERTIRHLIAAMEALDPARPSPSPGTSEAPPETSDASGEPETAAGEPAPASVPADVISAQLSDLDDVLEAIEQATRSLERTYADEIAPDEETGEGSEAEPGEGPGVSDPRPEPS